MTIRMITPAGGAPSVTVPAPGDPYSTPTTFPAGQVLDIAPGSAWETALAGNITALTGNTLNSVQTGSDPAGTDNA